MAIEKILRVTYTEDYYIKMIDDGRTAINGWTMKQLIKDWFINFSLGSFHATREGHRIGNSRKYIKCEVITER